jgi:hypothetical protein
VRAQGSLADIEASDGELVKNWRTMMSREALEEKRGVRSEAARERWQLLRLVSRIGVQLKQRNIADGTWQTDEAAHVVSLIFYTYNDRNESSTIGRLQTTINIDKTLL